MAVPTLGRTLRAARLALGLTQRELALRAEVSERLVREVERGIRPHVSFDTTLRLLAHVGFSMRMDGPSGHSVALRAANEDEAGQRARAEIRRRTWFGRQATGLSSQNEEPIPASLRERSLTAVADVSETAAAIAQAKPRRSGARRTSANGR